MTTHWLDMTTRHDNNTNKEYYRKLYKNRIKHTENTEQNEMDKNIGLNINKRVS